MNTKLLNAIGQIDDELILQAETHRMSRFSPKRIIALIAALVLMLCGTFTALAGTVPDVNELLYHLWPWAAQALKPVCLVSEDQGIRMEVISATLEGSESWVYLSMQDLTGNRIDATTDLFDSAYLTLPYDGSGTIQPVSYDEETRTATFLVYMNFNTDQIQGGNVTFRVSNFLSGITETSVDLTDMIDWNQALKPDSGTEQPAHYSGGWGGTPFSDDSSSIKMNQLVNQVKILSEKSSCLIPVTDGISITHMGTIDGICHIRMRFEDNLNTDNHAFLRLIKDDEEFVPIGLRLNDEDGKAVMALNSLSIMDNGDQIEEFFLMLDPETLDSLRVYAECFTASPAIHGNWEVTFPLESIQNTEE